jgi:hypothetical protein
MGVRGGAGYGNGRGVGAAERCPSIEPLLQATHTAQDFVSVLRRVWAFGRGLSQYLDVSRSDQALDMGGP